MLTDVACRNAKCPEGRAFQRFTDSGGLYLEVTKTGAKCWRWKYSYAGKEKRLSLGRYPSISLALARAGRDRARTQLANGIDPSEAKRDVRRNALARAETVFEKIAHAWWQDWRGNKNERHATYVLKRLEADAFPRIGLKPVADLNAPAFVRMAKSIEARGAADIARRVLQTCGQVMRYAVAHGLTDRNPVAEVRPGDVLKARQQINFARIGAEDLPDLLRKIVAYDGSGLTITAARSCVTGAARATWKELLPALTSKVIRPGSASLGAVSPVQSMLRLYSTYPLA